MNKNQVSMAAPSANHCLNNLRNLMATHPEVDLAITKNNGACAMGQWLRSIAPFEGDTDTYKRLYSLHSECHNHAVEVLRGVVPPVMPPIVIDGKVLPPRLEFNTMASEITSIISTLKVTD